MNVRDLRDALDQMCNNGHDDVEVMHVNGNGVAKPVLGWELVLAQSSDNDERKSLKLYTVSPF